MTHVQVGLPAPNATVMTLSGETMALADFWGNGRAALLVFLRHLG